MKGLETKQKPSHSRGSVQNPGYIWQVMNAHPVSILSHATVINCIKFEYVAMLFEDKYKTYQYISMTSMHYTDILNTSLPSLQ